MDVTQITQNSDGNAAVRPGVAETSRSAAGLTSDDFFKLLISQITNQDPLEPTGNEELLRQISSIRDIELSTTLTESLQSLTGQQQFGSASILIGQHVTSVADENGAVQSGVVVGVKFDATGQPLLQLSNGAELPMDRVGSIASPVLAAEALIGQLVAGLDRRNAAEPEVVDGLATAVRIAEGGEVIVELDSGDELRLRDVMTTSAVAA